MATPQHKPVDSATSVLFPDVMLEDGLQDFSKGSIDPSNVENFNNMLNNKVSQGDEDTLTKLIAQLQENPTDSAAALKLQLLASKLGFSLNFITAVVGKITTGVNTLLSAQA